LATDGGQGRGSSLSPYKIGRAPLFPDVVDECSDVLVRALPLVLVEPEVAIVPVDSPESSGRRLAHARDREPGVVADAVPRRADFQDVDVPLGGVGLDLGLVPELFGTRSRAHSSMRGRSASGNVVTAREVPGAAGHSPGPALPPTEGVRGVVLRRWKSVKPQVNAAIGDWLSLVVSGNFWTSCCPSVAREPGPRQRAP
jgi:hypothetical protein